MKTANTTLCISALLALSVATVHGQEIILTEESLLSGEKESARSVARMDGDEIADSLYFDFGAFCNELFEAYKEQAEEDGTNSATSLRMHMNTMAASDTLYIPTREDCERYFDEKQSIPFEGNKFYPQIKAIYEIRNIRERDNEYMMKTPSAVLNIWGYALHLRNAHDIAFDWLLNCFERDDSVFLAADGQWIFWECKVRNILLWIAIGGMDSPKLLQPSTYWAYDAFGLTDEQVEILKAKYNENPDPNSSFDEYIRALFKCHFQTRVVQAGSGLLPPDRTRRV
jgi:hypothetical protein